MILTNLGLVLGPLLLLVQRVPGFFAGGGGQRRPCTAGAFAARADGGLGLINIRLRYIASIEYSERFFFLLLFAIVKKFVDKKIGGREQGGGHDPPRIRACIAIYILTF